MFPPDELVLPKRRFGFREVGVIVVALAVVVASIYSVRSNASRHNTVVGTLTLYQAELHAEGTSCAGSGEYRDLAPGGRVTVRNRDGDTIAVGQLDRGDWLGEDACRFRFAISDIPRTSIYSFEVAARDRVEYTRDELEDSNWRIFLTAGDPPHI